MKTTTSKTQKINTVTSNTNSFSGGIEAMNPANNPELKDIVIANLNGLIAKHNMTQKDLALQVGYCEAAICRYFRGRQFPPIDFLFKLKQLYDISIDDFVSKKIVEPVSDPHLEEVRRLQELTELDLHKKYCGNYLVYYLDTSNYKGRDYNSPTESLVYGIISIYEVQTSLNKSEFNCYAILGLNNRSEANRLKEGLDSLTSEEDITNYIYSSTHNPNQHNIYKGNFTLGEDHGYINLEHGKLDKALVVLYRLKTNKEKIIGGMGVINSGSKGRERMPTAQFIAFSRYPISLSPEEIHHNLLLTHPTYKADSETKELIALFKHYFLYDDNDNGLLSDYQKELIMKVNIEDAMKKIIARNMDRYAKVSERDDAAWYQVLKDEEKKYLAASKHNV